VTAAPFSFTSQPAARHGDPLLGDPNERFEKYTILCTAQDQQHHKRL
jgi:hypothetical protein